MLSAEAQRRLPRRGRALLQLALALVALVGCSQHGGRLVVLVESDVSRFREVRVRAYPEGSTPPLAAVPLDNVLPLSFVIEPRDPSRMLEVEVAGFVCDPALPTCQPIVRRERARVTRNETRLLRIFLATECEGRACPAETCERGACIPIPELAAEDLPILSRPGAELDFVDGGARDASPPPDGGPPPTELQIVTDGSFAPSQRFGAAVALDHDGGRLLVGIPRFLDDSDPGHFGAFGLYEAPTFARSWSVVQEGRAGTSVAIRSDAASCEVMIGAPEFGLRSVEMMMEPRGATLVANCVDGGLTRTLTDLRTVRDDASGTAVGVSLDGRQVVAGAPGPDDTRGYVTFFDDGVVTRPIETGVELTGGRVGLGVAMAHDGWTIVGAPGHDEGPSVDQGAVYAIGPGAPRIATRVEVRGAAMERLGSSVAISGDGMWAAAARLGEVVVLQRRGSVFYEFTTIRTDGEAPVVALDDAGSHLVMGDASRRAAWIAVRNGTWTDAVALPGTGDLDFGAAVAISGDGHRIAVGAPGSAAVHLLDVP